MQRASIAVVVGWLALVGAASAGDAVFGARIRSMGPPIPEPSRWVAVDGARVVTGHGSEIVVRHDGATSRHDLAVPADDALLWGHRLLLAGRDSRLRWLDLSAPALPPSEVPMDLVGGEAWLLADMGGRLVAGESRRGVHLLEPVRRHGHAGHAGHPPDLRLRSRGFVPFDTAITALAASVDTIYVASGATLVVVDARDLDRPAVRRGLVWRQPIRAMAANGTTLYLLGPLGLDAVDLVDGRPVLPPRSDPDVRGTSLALNGRLLHVAGEGGLVRLRDETGAPQTIPVTVGDNFYSPGVVTLDPGDTVRWTNFAGFHNVFSCNAGQTGCNGMTSNENFDNGPPAPGIWLYEYTFQLPGCNPYLCQSHATTMPGTVVSGPLGGPPGVPAGSPGVPITVDKLDAAGSTLSLGWDTACAGAASYNVLYSIGMRLPNALGGLYRLAGAACDVGASPFTWTGTPDPSTDPNGLIWFVVVAADGSAVEGSWGRDSAGGERDSLGTSGSSQQCGVVDKQTGNVCCP